jgi:uracil-DNA glycosylase
LRQPLLFIILLILDLKIFEMDVRIEESWKQRLKGEFTKDYFLKLASYVKEEYHSKTIYPPGNLIFNAFNLCPFDRVKAVIIGQDPYHGPDQAHGLCFSVHDGITHPPSLINIFKEIEADLGIKRPLSGNLERWAKQGVLLLNATLTVRAHQAGSHQKKGWEQFTDEAINSLDRERKNIVFFLWGSYAQKKGENIDKNNHLVLKSVHPSPLSASRGFFGNHHFSLCNEYLAKNGIDPVQW